MLILGLIMAALAASFLSATRASNTSDYRIQNLEEGRLLIENLSKDLRTAAPPTQGAAPFFADTLNAGKVLAGDKDVTFYADLNTTGLPRKVRLYIDSTNPSEPVLTEIVQAPDDENATTAVFSTPAPAGKVKTRLVGRYILNGGSYTDAILIYEQADGTRVGPTPLTTTDAQNVRAITIKLKVRRSTSLSVAATTLETRVRLPNVIYGLQAGATT